MTRLWTRDPDLSFQSRVRVDAASGCWEWQGWRNGGAGYGYMRADGRDQPAHRWSYEHHVGPIPDGMEIDHLCMNRGCVNPDHLEPVSPNINVVRSGATKLSAEDVRKVRELRADGMTCAAIGRLYALNRATVSRLVRGIGRADVPLEAPLKEKA